MADSEARGADEPRGKSPGTAKRIVGTGCMAYLVVGMVFPVLFIAAFQLWELLGRLFLVLNAPTVVVAATGIVGAVSGFAFGFWLCRLIWRYFRESTARENAGPSAGAADRPKSPR